MADDIPLNPGSGGVVLRSDDIGGKHFQVNKLAYGADGVASMVEVNFPLPVQTGRDGTALRRFLDTNGDGTGTKNANLTHAVADDYFIAPASGIYVVEFLDFFLRDAAINDTTKFGDVAALTNGVLIEKGPSTIIDFVDGLVPKTNWELMQLGPWTITDWANGSKILHVRLDFVALGRPCVLDQASAEKLVVTLEDDLTGLDSFFMVAGGYSTT